MYALGRRLHRCSFKNTVVKGILSEVFFTRTYHLLEDVLLSTHISVVQAKEDEDANALKKINK